MSSTTARVLEETFQLILQTGFGDSIPVLLRNEESTRTTPCVVLSAEETGDFLGVRVAGRVAKICTLEVECRIDGHAENSVETLEELGGAVENLFAASAGDGSLFAAWIFLRFIDSSKRYEFEDTTRVLTCSFELHALTVA